MTTICDTTLYEYLISTHNMWFSAFFMEIKYLLTHFWLCNVMGVLELDMEALPVSSVSHMSRKKD